MLRKAGRHRDLAVSMQDRWLDRIHASSYLSTLFDWVLSTAIKTLKYDIFLHKWRITC
jgi:hypothetical protein